MGIHYEFHDNLAVFTYSGDFDMRTLVETWDQAIADPAFKAVTKVLVDGRMSELNMPTEQMELQAIYVARTKRLRTAKWAVVAEINSLAFGLSRMFQMFAEDDGLDIQVFKDYDEALAWLSADAPAPPA